MESVHIEGGSTMHAIVDSECKITLSPELGVEPGDEVVLERRGDEWILRVEKVPAGLVKKGNILVHPGVATESIENAVERSREERLDQLSEGIPR
jgi:hypothetical protein